MPFARWNDFSECTLEQRKLGHDEEDANKICGEIQERSEKGALLKAEPEGFTVLSKASDPDIVLGDYASWDCKDDEQDEFSVDAQVKALDRFMNLPANYHPITVNHGLSWAKEFVLAEPILKYTDSKGKTYYTHVNEKGTYLISKLRNDSYKTTQYYRKAALEGKLNGYSVTAVPTVKDPKNPHRVLDMEYSAITITEKGVLKPINPKTRNVEVISKGADLAVINDVGQLIPLPDATMKYPNDLTFEAKNLIEAILAKHGFTKS